MSTENEVVDDQLDIDEPVMQDDDNLEVVIDDTDEPDVETEADVEAAAEAQTAEAEEVTEAVQEADEAEAVADQEPEDAELASMPVKFKKRLEREIRLREQIRGEREQIKAAAVQVAQLAQQREHEVLQLKKQNAALQKQFAETLDYAFDRDISIKAADLRKAREDGDYDREIKLQGELDQLRFQHNQVKQAKTTLPDPETIAAPAPAAQQPQQQAQQPVQRPREQPSPLAVKWLDTNKAWFGSPKFAGHRAFALAEDSRLVAEGYDKNTKEYYDELDRRIDEAFPTLRKKSKTVSSPVAPATSAPARNTSKNVIKLTRADLENMRRFGLDTSDKETLREYARNKRSAA